VGPSAGLDDVEKSKFLILPGLEIRSFFRPELPRLVIVLIMVRTHLSLHSVCVNSVTYTYQGKRPHGILVIAAKQNLNERTIPTERPPLVGKVSANFCGQRVPHGQRYRSLRSYSRISRPNNINN
jgi:hypothetical protein